MSQSNEILEPYLVAANSSYLSYINYMAQEISSSTENLSMVLDTLILVDDVNKDIMHTVRSDLFLSNQHASDISDLINAIIKLDRKGD